MNIHHGGTETRRLIGLISSALVVMGVFACSAVCFAETRGNCTKIDDSSRPDCPRAIAFFSRLQNALKNDDNQMVVSMVHYPLLTSLHNKKVHIRNREELLSRFDEVFDAGVRCGILDSTSQDVWGNWQGFTIKSGEVWFDAMIPPGEHPDVKASDYWTKYPFAIITVNNGYGKEHCNHR